MVRVAKDAFLLVGDMDKIKAQELTEKLSGTILQDWKISELIDHGKSAAVFKGHNVTTGDLVAVKVFDDELIARYGDDAQISRIKRELDLVGKSHENMVKILGGGFDCNTKNHYLVMQYLDGPNLKKCLQDVPIEHVPTLVSQLASCCEYLETLGLVHRDIKPENIVLVDDLSRLILLDFGVVRPVGQGDVTDEDGVQAFVGTLQYSSPEFLLRTEEDTIEGWRALTFYQIGAVLHDLIMRTPIFSESTQPYARLVNAVQQDTPTIASSSYPSYLVETSKICLSKQPDLRIQLLNWSSFHPPKQNENSLEEIRKRVSRRTQSIASSQDQTTDAGDQKALLLENVISHLKVKVRSVRKANQAAFPPTTVTRTGHILFVDFDASASHSLVGKLRICLRIEVMDAASGLIKVEAAAEYTQQDVKTPDNWSVLHQGLSTGGDLSSAIEKCMYLAMDQAQQISGEFGCMELDLADSTKGQE
jgi:serine/threonine protein kinase